MYKEKKISLVIPAYNEERLIRPTLENVPETIDKIYVVNDCSKDKMAEVVKEIMRKDSRIELINHERNMGVGQAIITGYKRSSADGYDIAVVVGGDFQMDLADLPNFLDPLINGSADYTKGNRFMNEGNAFEDMPRVRLIGNTLLSLLTKISSGCYHIFDAVDGYTAITKRAIDAINWNKAWKKYGYVLDFLVRLNAYGFRVMDVPRRAIYLPGERQSQIKGGRYLLKVLPMLVRDFFWRLGKQYILRDFHPLVFLYVFGMIFFFIGMGYGIYILLWRFLLVEEVSIPTAAFCMIMLNVGIQSIFFAMLFDMMNSKRG